MPSNLNQFPFPFAEDTFRYTNNSVPLEPPVCMNVTADYSEEIELKRRLLANHPERCYRSLPHTLEAQREVADLLTHQLGTEYARFFTTKKTDNKIYLSNKLTGDEEVFDDRTEEPLNQIGRHVQEDSLLLSSATANCILMLGNSASLPTGHSPSTLAWLLK